MDWKSCFLPNGTFLVCFEIMEEKEEEKQTTENITSVPFYSPTPVLRDLICLSFSDRLEIV